MEKSIEKSIEKSDAFGRVERVEVGGRQYARRVLRPGRLSPARWLARALAARERAALAALAGVEGVPAPCADPRALTAPGPDGRVPTVGDAFARAWVEGEPLSRARELPADFFEQLEALVLALHARGVCHNDLHKEANVLAGADGWPWLIDYQLASVHRRRGWLFRSRAREDLRHVEKHRRRYTKGARAPEGVARSGAGAGIRRGWLARAWRALGKPLYRFATGALGLPRDRADAQRPPAGPWPRWTAPRGVRS